MMSIGYCYIIKEPVDVVECLWREKAAATGICCKCVSGILTNNMNTFCQNISEFGTHFIT